MTPTFVSSQDIQMLLARQNQIAADLYNQEFDDEEETDIAESNYYASINLLYITLGESAHCKIIDPILWGELLKQDKNADETLCRRDVLVKLGKSH